jgi:hypothetical protein
MVNKVIQYLTDAFKEEPFVNTVTTGDIFDVDLNKQTIFPLTHIIINNVLHGGNQFTFNISILCMDVIDEDKLSLMDNKLDIWNTQLLVINRVIDRINRGDLRDGEFELTGNPSIEPFTDRFENALAGWTVTFDLMVKNSMTIC